MNTEEMLNSGSGSEGDGVDVGQKIMIGLVALVILVGGYFVFRPTGQVNEEQQGEPAQTISAFAPVIDGDKVYTLDGVDWVFEPQTADENGVPTTRVRLQFKGFKRNDTPIDVAMYRLGTYRGECQSGAAVKGEPVPPTPHALSFAQCWWGQGGRQLSVYQEGGVVVVKARSINADVNQSEEQVPILTIDLTKVVQPAL